MFRGGTSRFSKLVFGMIRRRKIWDILLSEDVACNEASEQVVSPDKSAGSYDKELNWSALFPYSSETISDSYRKRNGKDEKTFPVNVALLLRPVKHFPRNPTNSNPIPNTQQDRISPRLIKPQAHGFPSTPTKPLPAHTCILNKVDCKEKKRITQSIIRTGLGNDNPLQRLGDILISELALDDGVGQHRVRRRNTGANSKGMQEREIRHEGPDHEGAAHPHGSHSGPKEQRETPPFDLQVPLWQLDAGED